jgi:hypothetical protein
MLGGEMVFDHGAGIPTAKIEVELQNREAGHEHEGGPAAAAESTHTHQDPPGTPPHEH